MSQNQEDQPSFDVDDLRRLRFLVDTLGSAASAVHLAGSPLASLFSLFSEVLLDLQNLSSNPLMFPRKNEGLKFVEAQELKTTDSFREYNDDARDIYEDPLTRRYYRKATDPLNNPLQVKIVFPEVRLNPRDANTLREFLADLAEIFLHLSVGRLDFGFFRRLRRVLYSPDRKDRQPNKTQKNRQNFFHRVRRK